MKHFSKVLISSAIIFVLGLVLIIFGAIGDGFDEDLSFRTEQVTFSQKAEKIEIDASASGIVLKQEKRNDIVVEYYVNSSYDVDVRMEEGTLKITQTIDRFFIYDTGKSLVTITMPIYETALSIRTEAGAVSLENVQLNDCKIKAEAGAIKFKNVQAKDVELNTEAGLVELKSFEAEKLNIQTEAGAIRLEEVKTNSVQMQSSFGAINGEHLTANSIKATSDVGAITLKIEGHKSDYTILSSVHTGSCNVSSQTGTTDKKLEVSATTGSVKVTFLK